MQNVVALGIAEHAATKDPVIYAESLVGNFYVSV
jgi:hypothetical protein